jgi:hypothetical protein
MSAISPQRRSDIIDALRAGAVPRRGLEVLAVGLDHFDRAIAEELEAVRAGGSKFKAVRAEYGGGKTFFARWVQERAKRLGFATSEVQISETETPLHRLETVYRRLMERLSTASVDSGALRSIVDGWFFAFEEDVLANGVAASDSERLLAETERLMQSRLSNITDLSPSFAAALRGYRIQLEARILQNFVDAVMHAIALLDQLHAVARQISLFASLARRHKAGLDEPVGQQLGQPLTVPRIRLSAWDILYLIGVGQDQMEMAFQNLPDRLPVHAGRLHRQMRHFLRKQPKPQVAQCLALRGELLLANLRFGGVGVDAHANRHRVLMDIDTATARI